jgi:hypothetical protein
VTRKEEIGDLIGAFARSVHEDKPNPKRVGCPGRPALTALAKESESLDSDLLLEHIRKCAACLEDLKELKQAAKRLHR